MDSSFSRTIVAIATPPGKGGVGIVRVSGQQAFSIAKDIVGKNLAPRQATYTPFYDADHNIIDNGIALYFKAPHSFTGEDVLELQAHGGPVVLDMLVARALALGAELAQPGEFSLRAFLNDKMDLVQAEAIADVINATSKQSVIAAQKGLQGVFSHNINTLAQEILQLRIYVEAAIDFPEEEIDFLSQPHIRETLQKLRERNQTILSQAKQGSLLRDGLTVVIAGKPNAGKSSLLNYLAQREIAIVTDIPGTTRDLIRETVYLDDIPLHIIDTAGLRKTLDKVEQEGIRRAQIEIANADKILWLVDATEKFTAQDMDDLLGTEIDKNKIIILCNKSDLHATLPTAITELKLLVYQISAKTGDGIAALSAYLKQQAGWEHEAEHVFMARTRHVNLLTQSCAHLDKGWAHLDVKAGELLAEELRCAHQALGEITGAAVTADELLGKIFANFCIGK